MQQKRLVILLVITSVFFSILFAGVLTQKTDDSADEINNAFAPTVQLAYSFPSNTTITACLSSPSSTTNTSSALTPEKLTITSVQLNEESDTFIVTVLNNGPSQSIISDVSVNEVSAYIENEIAMPPNSYTVLSVSLHEQMRFLRTYEIQLQSLDGDSATFFKTCW
ncbi:MAG: hypothetical protein ACQCN6_08245 [Candidatus Bathyarchaeia archaeon]|jgi:archaellum component FlaF (FlaF/FlaG flagellin family)